MQLLNDFDSRHILFAMASGYNTMTQIMFTRLLEDARFILTDANAIIQRKKNYAVLESVLA